MACSRAILYLCDGQPPCVYMSKAATPLPPLSPIELDSQQTELSQASFVSYLLVSISSLCTSECGAQPVCLFVCFVRYLFVCLFVNLFPVYL